MESGAALPVALTRLVGRAEDVRRLRALLADAAVRLVTLTGPGGVGKTRLAVEAAAPLEAVFPGGVRFVGLASLSEPELVLPAVAEALGVPASPRTPLLTLVRGYLEDRRALLILDSFEHLLAGAPVVTELLAACPRLTVLATSRAPLRLAGEREIPVRALPVVEQRGLIAPAGADACDLFLDRARAVLPGYAPDDEERRAIEAICRLADGLPLAIELAAARLRLLPPVELARQLRERPLALLSGGARDAPARQRTLRDTIAWSYDLLPQVAQRALRHLSVLAGPWTLDAAAAVCAQDVPHDVGISGGCERAVSWPLPDVFDLVQTLVENGLVQRAPGVKDHAAAPRFALLETVREFAAERLRGAGEEGAARQRHAEYYLQLTAPVRDAPAAPWSVPFSTIPRGFEADLADLRAAARTLEASGRSLDALRIALVVVSRGTVDLAEARVWLDRLAAAARAEPAGAGQGGMRVRAYARALSALFASAQRDLTGMEAAAQECRRLAAALGDERQLAQAITLLGTRAAMAGDYDAAASAAERVLAMDPPVGSHARVVALRNVGIAHRERGDVEEAEVWFRRSLAEAGPSHDRGRVLEHLGILALYCGDPEAARRAFALSLEESPIFDVTASRSGFDNRLEWLAAVEAASGRWNRASALLQTATRLEGASWRDYPVERAYLERVAAEIRAHEASGSEPGCGKRPDVQPLSVQQAVALFLSDDRSDDGGGQAAPGARRREAAPSTRLSPREREVGQQIARGLTNPEIATALGISEHTVLRHVEHIMAKLGVNRRAQIAAWVAEHGAGANLPGGGETAMDHATGAPTASETTLRPPRRLAAPPPARR